MHVQAKPAPRSYVKDYLTLVKYRLLALVLLSTALGYYLGVGQNSNYLNLLNILIGVAFVGGGANALNQYLEHDCDALMLRTRNRPLPSGRLAKINCLYFGIGISLIGFAYLAATINSLTLGLCFLSWASYLFIYTPLKRVTKLNTWVGTIPGALPAVLGWTAATAQLSWDVGFLFAILYFWQLAHFFAISWIYREDYSRGGFKMLPLNDSDGMITARQIVINSLLLLLASINLFLVSDSGLVYLACAFIAGLVFIFYSFNFYFERSINKARKVFLVSIIYLPVIFLALIIDRILI